jgi:fused signal recognition particle receptor
MQDSVTERDPWELIMNAGSDTGLWVLLTGPLALLLLVAIIYVALYLAKKKREQKELHAAVEESQDKSVIPLPTSILRGPEELKTPKPYRIPPELEGTETPEPRPTLTLLKRPGASAEVDEVIRTDSAKWRERLTLGLSKTRNALRANLQSVFGLKTKIDASMLESLHEVLYRADIGVATADKLVDHVRKTVSRDEATSWETVAVRLKEQASSIMDESQKIPLKKPERGPWVILIVGVNGVGKTTTIGKLAAHFLASDKKVLLAAADTFRAAAIEQLSVWGERLGVEVIKHQAASDPAAVAYDAVKAAMARDMDVLLIDTAGRLHAKAELMAELGKINRIIGRDLPGAPHETWLVVDATTGQNAVQQVKAFKDVVDLSGIIVTKLDGTAKGGVLIGITDQFGIPIRYIGVGEKAADLRTFNASEYVESLF